MHAGQPHSQRTGALQYPADDLEKEFEDVERQEVLAGLHTREDARRNDDAASYDDVYDDNDSAKGAYLLEGWSLSLVTSVDSSTVRTTQTYSTPHRQRRVRRP